MKWRSKMDKNSKGQQGEEISNNEQGLLDRRGFLLGLKKWSKIVIGGVLAGSALLNPGREEEAAAWVNRGGGGTWANRAGGGAAVVKPGGSAAWANHAYGGGSAAWVNRGAGWANRGASWVNRF
jgi:hypothetical protein